MTGLIVILVDGLGAQGIDRHQNTLPNLCRFSAEGTQVKRLGAQRCATSMPGRASLLTGVPSSQHGIYGNVIWGGDSFRNANAKDIRVPTLSTSAKKAGLKVAGMGFGLVHDGECDVFQAPFWADEMLHNNFTEDAADAVWHEAMSSGNPKRILPALEERAHTGDSKRRANGQACDAALLRWAAELAADNNPPDLILAEIASPDYFSHVYGHNSEQAVHALSEVDHQIGEFIQSLKTAQVLDNFNIVITSDHGFTEVKKSIHPDVLLPEATFACEGAYLHLAFEGTSERKRCTSILTAHGASAVNNDYLPKDQRSHIASFLAPQGFNFYRDYFNSGEPVGRSKYRATHGFAPGHPGDEKFVYFSGPDIPNHTVDFAPDEQLTPTLASLLNLSTDHYADHSLFQ